MTEHDISLNDPSREAAGVKTQTDDKSDPEKQRKPEEQRKPEGHRQGEIPFGVPEPKDVTARPMSNREKEKYRREDFAAEQKRLERLSAQLFKELKGFQLPSWLKRTCIWGLLAVAAVLILLLVGQVTTFLSQLKTLPLWSQWLVGALLSLVALIVLVLVIKILLLSLKLKRNEQINFAVIEALSKREELRNLAYARRVEAVDKLKDYLKSFPVQKEEAFLEIGMTRDHFASLARAHKKLLDGSQPLSSDKWLDLYRAGFQLALDETAANIHKSYARRVALKTAISPLPMLDTVIVLGLSLAMVKDMMTLYNLKFGTVAAAYVLVHAIGQAYIAGELQDISESFVDSLNDTVADHVGQVASTITTAIGSKTGEGVANGIMMFRLGKATRKLLQPTR